MDLNIIKRTIIAFAIMFLVSLPVVAESGTISIVDTSTKSYSFSDLEGGTGVNWSQIRYDSANMNNIESFNVLFSGASFVQSFESTSFIISQGGSGSGMAHYDSNTSKIYWVFTSGNIYTTTPLTLSYSKNIFANITGLPNRIGNEEPSANKPVCIGSIGQACNGATAYYEVKTGLIAQDSYVVYYPFSGYFSVSIDKNPSINTKYFIDSYSGTTHYSQETGFNKVDINNATFEYGNGISLNTTLSNGVYVRTYINASDSAASEVTGTINFNKSSYNLYEDFNISWNINNIDTINEDYGISVYKTSTGQTQYTIPVYSSSWQGIAYTGLINPDATGTYAVELFKISYSGGVATETILDTDTIYYGSDLTQTPTGNFSVTNTPRQGNDLNITYNSSLSVRLSLYDYSSYQYYILPKNTNTKYQIYLPKPYHTGLSVLKMEYWDNIQSRYILLDSEVIAVLPYELFDLRVGSGVYTQGDTIEYYPYSTYNNSYIFIKSPSGEIINSLNLTVNSSQVIKTTTNMNSITGTYTGELYGNGSLLISKTTYLNYGMQTPVSTRTGNVTSTPVTLIDITSELSDGILGKLDSNSDGLNSNEELSGFGNKILSTLVLIVIILLISGIFSRKR